jgi:hypothetical protein
MAFSIIWALKICICRIQLPKDADIKRRLEEVNTLELRPLTVLIDYNSIKDNPPSNNSWSIYNASILLKLNELRVGFPKPIFAGINPFGVRAGIGFLFVISGCVFWNSDDNLFLTATTPNFICPNDVKSIELDFWLPPNIHKPSTVCLV